MRRTLLIVLQFLLSVSYATAVEVVEGEWEITVSYTVSGMPISNPDEHYSECLTQDNPIPTSYLNARQCDLIEQKARHRTIYYKLSCFTEHGSVVNEGKVRYGDFRISGKSRTDVGDVSGRSMVMRYKFSGRRLGDCQ